MFKYLNSAWYLVSYTTLLSKKLNKPEGLRNHTWNKASEEPLPILLCGLLSTVRRLRRQSWGPVGRKCSQQVLAMCTVLWFIFIVWVFWFLHTVKFAARKEGALGPCDQNPFGLEGWRLWLICMPSLGESVPVPEADRGFLASLSERNEQR